MSREADFLAFHMLATDRISKVGTSLDSEPLAKLLAPRERLTAIVMACLRMAALACVGGKINPEEFDGLLAKYTEKLTRQFEAQQ